MIAMLKCCVQNQWRQTRCEQIVRCIVATPALLSNNQCLITQKLQCQVWIFMNFIIPAHTFVLFCFLIFPPEFQDKSTTCITFLQNKNSTYSILTCPLDLSVRARKAEMCGKKEGNGVGDKMSWLEPLYSVLVTCFHHQALLVPSCSLPISLALSSSHMSVIAPIPLSLSTLALPLCPSCPSSIALPIQFQCLLRSQ